jgi:hypothetical protein
MLNGNVIKKEVGTLLMNIRTIPKYLILIIAFFALQANSNDADKLKNAAKKAVKEGAVGIASSYLEKYFDVFELSIENPEDLSSASILVLKGLSDPDDIKNTVFTQGSLFLDAGRATLNLGLGYRRLVSDNKLLLGVNTFYDQEYPYRHGRASLGLEARTTVGEVNFNRYWATTSWQAGANGLDEHALGGVDLEIGIPLPYMNWATFYARAFKWDSVIRGGKDSIGNDLSFRAEVPVIPGLAIEAGHRQYSSNESSDNFVKFEYDVIQGFKKEKAPLFTSYAYKMSSMENQRLKKVRRENKIYKQFKSSTVTVKGF